MGMRNTFEFLQSKIHKKLGKTRTINSQSIRVYDEDENGKILMASGTAASTTQDSQSVYAKGAIYIDTDAVSGDMGVYFNAGTSSSSSFIQVGDSGIIEDTVSLTATEIVGTDAGDIGHSAGAVLVSAPGAGFTLEFISAVLIYDFDTAAYTGGGNDLVVRQGTTTLTPAIAGADLLLASGDKIVQVNALSASDQALTENSTLNLSGTAYTQPGTAAGTLSVRVRYKIHTTGL